MKKNKLNISNEKGGVAILVLFTILTFMVILMGAFMTTSILRKSQIKSDIKIKEIYSSDVKQVDEVYDEMMLKIAKTRTYDNPYIPEGFIHIGTEDWNSGYTIQEKSTGNEFVWVPCVLEQSDVKDGDTVEIFKKTLPTTQETTDPYYMYNENNYTITGDESPADAIRTSVGTYGGFYIAKYEAGVPLAEDETEIEVTSAIATQKARSVEGATVWTNITRVNAITAAANMIDSSVAGVNSGLISGECWDTTLQWMVNSSTNAENEPNAGYDTDSIGKGWYNDVSNNAKTTTGQYSINNIYDMAGNVWEWTTENCTYSGNSFLLLRGGDCLGTGIEGPASDRGHSVDYENSYFSFRVVLYK